MNSLAKTFAELGPLEYFDPAAFNGDAEVPQDVCSFVLALAVAYNDYRCLLTAMELLESAQPIDSEATTSKLAFWALQGYGLRLMFGITHELLTLVGSNENTLRHPFIHAVVGQMDRRAKASWNSLVAAALNRPTDDDRSRHFLLFRNKIAYHYDPKAIYRGYDSFFGTRADMPRSPPISRGVQLEGSWLYFANNAALGYVDDLMGREGMDRFAVKLAEFGNLTAPLWQIVTRFVQRRGFGWRSSPVV